MIQRCHHASVVSERRRSKRTKAICGEVHSSCAQCCCGIVTPRRWHFRRPNSCTVLPAQRSRLMMLVVIMILLLPQHGRASWISRLRRTHFLLSPVAELNRDRSRRRLGREAPLFVCLSSSKSMEETIATTTTTTTAAVMVSVVAERFHDDMRRVLVSRRQHNPMVDNMDRTERRHRPLILDADVDGAERVLSMLRHLETIQAATEESYAIVMRAFLDRGRVRWQQNGTSIICAADQLEDLLDRLLLRVSGSSLSMDTYNLVLEAYAICATPRGERDYACRADDLLQRMEIMFGSDHIPVTSLVHVLHAYAWQQANLQDGDCADNANQLLHQVIQRQPSDPFTLMQCYAWVIEALSKAGSPNRAQEATDLFRRMKALNATVARDHPAGLILDAETYSNVILAWSKASQVGSAQKAEDLLLEMLEEYKNGSLPSGSEPPLIAFNGVISAWGRQGSFDKAERVLFLMGQTKPTCTRLAPDAVSFNSVLYAQLRNPDKERAVTKALQLVNYMEDHCIDQPSIQPNSFTYGTLLKCLVHSRRNDMIELAENTVQKMEQLWDKGDRTVQPNNRIYNMMINAYAKSNDRYASRRALQTLDRMRHSDLYKPDIVTYTSVMECLSRSADPNAPEQVEALLHEAFELYNTTQSKALMPNLRTFTMAILTLANCQGSVLKARSLLTRLVELYEISQDPSLKPNEYPYNYVLNCAANTVEHKTEAFRVATQTYQEMRRSSIVRPDSFTYAFWLKCCSNLLPESDLRRNCVAYAFEECKADGLVSSEVLWRLTQGCPPDLVMELLELPDSFEHTRYRRIQLSDLPPKWSRRAQLSK